MFKQLYYAVFVGLLFAFSPILATIIHVPADQPTIRQAIDVAADGDTVLVARGTYRENVDFLGKPIVVASHYILNSDVNFILSTIIDGSNPSNPDTASCVLFYSGEDSGAVLQGFTITGGTGTKWVDPQLPQYTWRGGGGIFTFQSSPTIKNNLIIHNEVTNTVGVDGAQGGGTLSYGGNPRILNNIIMQNKARYGAGIVMDYSGGIIRNNIIYQNSGGQDYGGGGFWSIGNGVEPIIIENNHIVENSVTGGGAFGGRGGAMFVWYGTVTARNNIIWGNTQSQGGPIAEVSGGTALVTYSNVEGGFTGEGNIDLDPAFETTNLYLTANSPCIDAGNPNPMYNDPEDPQNPGLAQWPSLGGLRNDMGAYGGPLRGLFPLFISANLLNQPESVAFDSLNNRYFVSNAGNGNIVQINAVGAQSYFADYSTSIRGIYILGNTLFTAGSGGVIGFDINTADTTFILAIGGALFLNDITSDGTGYLYVTDSNAGKIYKIHINSQTYTTFVSGGLISPNGLLFDGPNNRLILCSFRSNSPIQAISLADSTVSTIVATNLDYLDGLAEDAQGNVYVSSWGSGSVYRYDHAFSSPPEMVSGGHSGPADIGYNRPVNILGVPNFNANTVDFVPVTPTAIEGSVITSPQNFDLQQNFPNPFNPVTIIKYQLPMDNWVILKVYDILGREVRTLVNERKAAGSYTVVWDGTDEDGRRVVSGVYLYRITYTPRSSPVKGRLRGVSKTRKMVLLR